MMIKMFCAILLITSFTAYGGEFIGSHQVDPPSITHTSTNNNYSRGSIVSGPHGYQTSPYYQQPTCPSGQRVIILTAASGSYMTAQPGSYVCVKR